jgi:hypothetical protein
LYIPHLAFNSMFSLRCGLPPMFIRFFSPYCSAFIYFGIPQVHELIVPSSLPNETANKLKQTNKTNNVSHSLLALIPSPFISPTPSSLVDMFMMARPAVSSLPPALCSATAGPPPQSSCSHKSPRTCTIHQASVYYLRSPQDGSDNNTLS